MKVLLNEIEEYTRRNSNNRNIRKKDIQFNKLYNETELEGKDDRMMNVNVKINAEPVFEVKDIKFEVVTLNGIKYITTNQISILFDKQLSKSNRAVKDVMDVLMENGIGKWEMNKYFIEFYTNEEEPKVNYYVSAIGFALISPAIMNNVNNNLMMKLSIMDELTK